VKRKGEVGRNGERGGLNREQGERDRRKRVGERGKEREREL